MDLQGAIARLKKELQNVNRTIDVFEAMATEMYDHRAEEAMRRAGVPVFPVCPAKRVGILVGESDRTFADDLRAEFWRH